MIEFFPEGFLIDTKENEFVLNSAEYLEQARVNEKIIEARAIRCDSAHNLIVDLKCMSGIIPRNEGAIGIKEGLTRDIAIISKVGKPVCFVVTDFQTDSEGRIQALLSRRMAQEICIEKFISRLIPGDVINAKITHMENFGVFADIGCGIISLLPIDSISVSRISHPCERFKIGMDIRVIIKSIVGDRINLTHKELLGTWEENAQNFHIGETVYGIVRSIEVYGIFIELTPNLAGLAESKPDVQQGQHASIYIKNIIPEKMKIKLVIIESFDDDCAMQLPKYFFENDHMDKFLYSPATCLKVIETNFSMVINRA
jgi:small subunit ribosomal protein S1